MRGRKFKKKKKQPRRNCISCWNLSKKFPTTKIWSKQILEANNNDDWRCRYESFCNTDDIYELQLYSNSGYLTYKSTYFLQGREQGTAMYAIGATVKVWFSSSLLWNRVYKSESLGLKSGIIFQDTNELFKDFSLDKGDQQLPIKITLCKFVDKNNYWENHGFKLEHDEVLKGI